MTRWLQAAMGVHDLKTEPTKPTEPALRPHLDRVLSVVSVLPKGLASKETGDAKTLAAFLRENGPASYGAAGRALGWGATRAWRVEAELRAVGRFRYDKAARAALVAGGGSYDRR